MTWLFEDPRPVLAGAVAIELMLLVSLIKSGRAAVLGVMAAVGAAGVALVALEWLVETDREQLDRQLHHLAERLKADDIEEVLSAIEAGTPAYAQAERALQEFRVIEARISGLEIKLRGDAQATADLFAHVQLRPRRGTLDMDRTVRRMEIDWRRSGGRWAISAVRDRGLDVAGAESN